MAYEFTLAVEDEWADTSHVILVMPTETRDDGTPVEWAVTVLSTETGREVEEVGVDTRLNDLMVDAARVVRTGTAAK